MSKKYRAGGEIDAYCTKCRLDLGHRIVAMVGDTVKKVVCQTCHSEHLYRVPMSQRGAKAAGSANGSARAAAPKRETAASRVTAAARAEREQRGHWESAIAGQPPTAFKPYRVTEHFQEGELVHHKKFGDGVVRAVVDRGKVEILFQDGPRTMAHGQT